MMVRCARKSAAIMGSIYNTTAAIQIHPSATIRDAHGETA
jgi:hypothetical protein